MTISRMRDTNRGYTLIELLVVIAIIGVLATISFFSFIQIQSSVRDSERSTEISVLSSALEKYYDKSGEYPDCSLLSVSDPKIVTSAVLKGLDPNVLTAPNAVAGTNSITCVSPVANTYAYLGGGLNYTLEYKEEASGKTISVDSDRQGTGDTHTLTLTAGTGGTVSKTPNNSSYSSGTTITITATANTYYEFSSWTGSTGCSGITSHAITITTNLACVANFTPIPINPPETPTVTANTTNYDTTWSWNTATCSGNTARYQYKYTIAPSGYDSGWTATTSTSLTFTTSVELQTYTVTVQAQCYNTITSSVWSASGSANFYRDTTYVLTLVAGTGGTVSGSGAYNTSFTPTMTASASTYYSFSSWTGDTGCSGIASHTITMSSNKTCTANFTPTAVAAPSAPVVTASTPGATTTWSWPAISCGANTARYQYKYTIAPSGYDSGWVATALTSFSSTTSTEDQTYTVTVQAQCYNVATTSAWSASGSSSYYRPIPQCSLTLVAGANGTVSGGGTYDCGTTPATPTITATANTYYSFSSWTGDTGCSGLASHNITTDAIKTCTASFVPTTITAPSAPVLSAVTGASTTWSWTATNCGANTARYQYRYTISPSGFDSGWIGPQAGTSVSLTTSSEGQTYTLEVQAQCYNTAASSNWSISSNAVLYLRPITYKTLTLIAGSNGTVSGGGSFATLSTPTMTATANTYYSFSSWTGDTGCSGVASHTIAMDTNKTCTANFVVNTCVLTVTGGTGGGSYNCGTTQTITASPPTYYSFSSWAGSTGCSGVASHTITLDVTKACTASFTVTPVSAPATPTVTPSTAGATTTYTWGAASCPGNTARYQYRYTISSGYDSGIVATTATSFPATTSTENLTYTVAVSAECYNSVTASGMSAAGSGSYYRPITYQTLTVNAGTGGTVSGGGSYATLSTPTITATASTGYTFSSWTTNSGNDCSGSSSHSFAITTATTCTANFTINTYYLTVNNGSGSGWYNYGSGPTITASVPTGYTFSSWTTNTGNDCSGSSSHAFTITTTTTCTANFTVNYYTVTLAAGTGGTVSGGGSYAYQSTPTITATASTGYTFSSWSGTNCTGNASHAVPAITAAMSCTANFTVNYYTLTVAAGTGGTVSGGGSYAYNSNPTMTATASGIYIFSSWTGSAGCSTGAASHTINMIAAKSCTASFIIDPHWIAGVGGMTGKRVYYMDGPSLYTWDNRTNGCTVGGRVPTITELEILYGDNIAYSNPYGVFQAYPFWSSTVDTTTQSKANNMTYSITNPGFSYSSLKTTPLAVRCVYP